MRLLNYIVSNVRFFLKRGYSFFDKFRIARCAERNFRKLDVPSWDYERGRAIKRQSNPITHLLSGDTQAIADAESILRGNFRILSKTISVAEMPDWHCDYFSGHVYKVRPYPSYDIPENCSVDIIAPWELSRFLFVPTLISAFLANGDEKYGRRFFELLDDWQKKNPYLHGINWMCALDIAIRAFNIALGLIHFGEIDPGASNRGRHLLWAHLVYLQKRDIYEVRRTVNNHLLVTLVLHYALLNLYKSPVLEKWRASAFELIENELAQQFHDDGGNYESAILYHQFVLESLFVAAGLICDLPQVGEAADFSAFPAIFKPTLVKASDFTASYAHAWHGVPQIGDSSDGRVFLYRSYFSWGPANCDYLAAWSGLLLGQQDPFGKVMSGGNLRIFAQSGMATYANPIYGVLCYVMPVAMRAAGHNHMDKTSFIFRVGEIPILVDTGTYCYTSNSVAREEHRSGRGHNVLLCNHADQADLDGKATFSAPQFGEMGISLEQGGGASVSESIFYLWHDGYRRFPGVGRVERRISCLADGIRIEDSLDGQGNVSIELIFNFHPSLSILLEGSLVCVISDQKPICTIACEVGWALSTEPGWFSTSYGYREANTRLVVSARCELPIRATTTFTIH